MRSSVSAQNQQTVLLDERREFPMPNRKTINMLWISVIGAFIFVMLMFALELAFFVGKMPVDQGCQYIYAILTPAFSFLAGLFITSPMQSRNLKNGVAE